MQSSSSPYRSGELSTWKVSLLFTYTMAMYSSTGEEYVYWTNSNGLIKKAETVESCLK